MKKNSRTPKGEPRPIVFMPGSITPEDMVQPELGIPDESLGHYGQRVKAMFACDNVTAAVIANLMGTVVCHCLLSDLSERQFLRAAKEARVIFEGDREYFLQANAEARALFHKGKREEAALKEAIAYEI